MRTINPNSNDIDSFKYSVLISLDYYDIPNNLQRISNLNKFGSQYNFSCNAPFNLNKIILTYHKTYTIFKMNKYTHQ